MGESSEGWGEIARLASDTDAIEAIGQAIGSIDKCIRKDGVRGFAMVVVQGDGTIGTTFYTGDVHYQVLGGLAELQVDIMRGRQQEA